MAEKLDPNDHQQEERAKHAKALAERIDRAVTDGKFGGEVTLKGETIDVNTISGRIIITANSDATYSLADGASHVTADEVVQQLAGKPSGGTAQ